MLLIIRGHQNEERELTLDKFEWHLGEPVPNLARVVTLQVDGDELNLFLCAMHATRVGDYSKGKGFAFKPHPWDCKCEDDV